MPTLVAGLPDSGTHGTCRIRAGMGDRWPSAALIRCSRPDRPEPDTQSPLVADTANPAVPWVIYTRKTRHLHGAVPLTRRLRSRVQAPSSTVIRG
jgi:hypothetical protein